MKGKTVFWRNDRVEILNKLVFIEDFTQSSMLKYLYCPCYYDDRDKGHFAQTERFNIYWERMDPSHFPEGFKLSLLIMGVTL
jgi:hypothetical protein